MPLLRFVHAADLHLDSPFSGLRNVAPEIASVLYRATFDAYDNIIDLCIDEKVDALLVAGDIFDGADKSLRAQIKFVDGLNRLHKAEIRSFICHGNHDPLDGWEAKLDMPSSCHRFGPTVERAPVFESEPERAVVHGISYPQREMRENLIPQFGTAEPGPFNIGLIHANVDNNSDHDSYAPCSLSDLEGVGIDYWALGHVHTRKILRQANPTVVYPGNSQGRHPNEKGARGVYLVEVSDSREVRTEFRSVDVVRWDSVDIDIGGLETDQALLNAIDERLAERQGASEGRHLVVRLSFVGRGELHSTLIRPEFIEDLLETVNSNWMRQTPFVWCERITDSTASVFDREQGLQGSDFMADLLKLSDEARGGQDAIAEMRELLSEIYDRGNSGRYLKEFIPSDEEMRELIASAEELCLTELIEEEGE